MTRKTKLKKGSLAARQQDAVNTIAAMRAGLHQLMEGPYIDQLYSERRQLGWFREDKYADGQVHSMLCTACDQLKDVLAAFDDTAEDGVEVPQS